jgi:hypothetical protein
MKKLKLTYIYLLIDLPYQSFQYYLKFLLLHLNLKYLLSHLDLKYLPLQMYHLCPMFLTSLNLHSCLMLLNYH